MWAWEGRLHRHRGEGVEPPLGFVLMLAHCSRHTGEAWDTGISFPGQEGAEWLRSISGHYFSVLGDLGGTRGKGE